MVRKVIKPILMIAAVYLGTIYLLYLIPSIIRYLMHRVPLFTNPVAYLIFNGIMFLFALTFVAAINTCAFLLTAKLF